MCPCHTVWQLLFSLRKSLMLELTFGGAFGIAQRAYCNDPSITVPRPFFRSQPNTWPLPRLATFAWFGHEQGQRARAAHLRRVHCVRLTHPSNSRSDGSKFFCLLVAHARSAQLRTSVSPRSHRNFRLGCGRVWQARYIQHHKYVRRRSAWAQEQAVDQDGRTKTTRQPLILQDLTSSMTR